MLNVLSEYVKYLGSGAFRGHCSDTPDIPDSDKKEVRNLTAPDFPK